MLHNVLVVVIHLSTENFWNLDPLVLVFHFPIRALYEYSHSITTHSFFASSSSCVRLQVLPNTLSHFISWAGWENTVDLKRTGRGLRGLNTSSKRSGCCPVVDVLPKWWWSFWLDTLQPGRVVWLPLERSGMFTCHRLWGFRDLLTGDIWLLHTWILAGKFLTLSCSLKVLCEKGKARQS